MNSILIQRLEMDAGYEVANAKGQVCYIGMIIRFSFRRHKYMLPVLPLAGQLANSQIDHLCLTHSGQSVRKGKYFVRCFRSIQLYPVFLYYMFTFFLFTW